MTPTTESCGQDVMQVCWNGHVITALLRSHPEHGSDHCERCGAQTLHHCLTCGREVPGAIPVPGLQPVGEHQPPRHCPGCGAAFPWARQTSFPFVGPLVGLDVLLRRLPRVVRQLRSRQGERPPFRVEDERDLEDLLRATLPLQSDDVRPLARTPSYAEGTRTDFLLAPERCVVVAKYARPGLPESRLAEQLREDADHHRRQKSGETLVAFVYDPEGVLPQPGLLERAWSRPDEDPAIRCVIAIPD
jgi:hypothetical protein